MLYSFDEFVLDTELRELRGPDGLVTLEPQVFDLLSYLIANRDHVVSRDEMLDGVWNGRIVSQSALSTRINAARHAIGDSGEMQRYIKTLPRKGVRFVGTVQEQGPAHTGPVPTGSPLSETAACELEASIAVLPFDNMSGDPDQEYFADGMVEEIITALSQMRWLSVIARNSSFAYKGKSVDVRQIGRELGVRYVLEGSVRKFANRIRITGQLLDASTGMHLWAHRFDGEIEDLFDLQDQVAANVVGALAPRLGQAEIDRARRKPTESLGAYDYYLRGMANVHRWTREANDQALSELGRAIELDSEFAAAYGLAARAYSQRKSCGWMVDRHTETLEAERLERLAAEFGKDDAVALCMAGIVLAYVVGEIEDGSALIDRALGLNANLAWAWSFASWVKIWAGEPQAAVQRGIRAVELSPNDPEVLFFMQTATAYSHFLEARYDEAFQISSAAIRERPNVAISLCAAAASGAKCGRIGDARRIVSRLRQIQPDMRVADLAEFFPFKRPDDAERWSEGMREAGLPD